MFSLTFKQLEIWDHLKHCECSLHFPNKYQHQVYGLNTQKVRSIHELKFMPLIIKFRKSSMLSTFGLFEAIWRTSATFVECKVSRFRNPRDLIIGLSIRKCCLIWVVAYAWRIKAAYVMKKFGSTSLIGLDYRYVVDV